MDEHYPPPYWLMLTRGPYGSSLTMVIVLNKDIWFLSIPIFTSGFLFTCLLLQYLRKIIQGPNGEYKTLSFMIERYMKL